MAYLNFCMEKEKGGFLRLKNEIPSTLGELHIKVVETDERKGSNVDAFRARVAEMVKKHILYGNSDFQIRGSDRPDPEIFMNIRAGIHIGLGLLSGHDNEGVQERLKSTDADVLLRKFINSGKESVMTKDGLWPGRYNLSATRAVKRMQDQ